MVRAVRYLMLMNVANLHHIKQQKLNLMRMCRLGRAWTANPPVVPCAPVLPKLLAPRCLAGPLSPPANPPARDADKMTSVGPNGNSIVLDHSALNVIAQFLFFVCKNKNY